MSWIRLSPPTLLLYKIGNQNDVFTQRGPFTSNMVDITLSPECRILFYHDFHEYKTIVKGCLVELETKVHT